MAVVLVGGGSILVDVALPLKGVSKLVIPKYSQVNLTSDGSVLHSQDLEDLFLTRWPMLSVLH